MATERDAHGRYRKALAAVITAFTGVSDLYESPVKTVLELRADRGTVEDGIECVLVLPQLEADA